MEQNMDRVNCNNMQCKLKQNLYMLKVVNNTTRCKKNVYSRY